MKRQQGFTIIELTVVVAIVGILISMAMPAFHQFILKQKIRSVLNEWQSSFYFAQREAIRLKQPIILCGSIDGENCRKPFSDFSDGWIVMTQKEKRILQDVAFKDSSLLIQLTGNEFRTKGVKFLSNGRIQNAVKGSLIVCVLEPKKTTEKCQSKSKNRYPNYLALSGAGRLTGKTQQK